MADDHGKYDPLGDLGSLLGAVLNYDMTSAVHYAGLLGLRLGVTGDDSAGTVTGKLREALAPAVTGTCELAPARTGTPCTRPAVIRLTGTCACGGVMERQACEECLTEKPLWCRACYRLPGAEAHECPVTFAGAEAAEDEAERPGQVSG